VAPVGSDLRIGEGLRPSEEVCRLSHGSDQVCSYAGPNVLVLWHIRESFEIHHNNSHIGTRGLEHMLVSHHVESIIKILWDQLPLLLFFVLASLGTISVALLALLSLIISFSIEYRFIIAHIEDQISSSRWKN